MALLYVEEAEASLNRATVASGETIYEGDFVVQNGSGDLEQFDPSADDLPHGIVVHYVGVTSDALVEHDEDYVAYSDLYKFSGGDDLYYQPLAAVDQVIPKTLSDNSTDPAPTLDEGSEMGIVTINSETEVVEAGYTDDGGTQYGNGGTGDYVAIGRLDKKPTETKVGDAYGLRVPVRLDADLYTV